MIRQEIKFFIEGSDYHNLCKWFAYLYYARSKKKVLIWSPQACHDFMLFEQWPGIPDMVITKTEEHQIKRTYVLEFENQPSEQKILLKQRQFKRYSITDVIPIPINKFEKKNDWKALQEQVEQWLP